MITRPINRGDIIVVNFGDKSGSVQNGCRPAIVLQRNRYNRSSSTTIVAPITSVTKKSQMSAHVVIGRRFGLLERSMVLLEQIQTIDQSAIDTHIGHIKDDKVMCRINAGLRKVLDLNNNNLDATYVLKRSKTTEGIAERKNRKKTRKKRPFFDQRDVMCLCQVCKSSYLHRGFRVVRAGGYRDTCDLCNYRTGFDYAVIGLLTR